MGSRRWRRPLLQTLWSALCIGHVGCGGAQNRAEACSEPHYHVPLRAKSVIQGNSHGVSRQCVSARTQRPPRTSAQMCIFTLSHAHFSSSQKLRNTRAPGVTTRSKKLLWSSPCASVVGRLRAINERQELRHAHLHRTLGGFLHELRRALMRRP